MSDEPIQFMWDEYNKTHHILKWVCPNCAMDNSYLFPIDTADPFEKKDSCKICGYETVECEESW